ncbi:MAG TPA: ISL3 family transposase [Rectinemataceae bacterium]|nr:ISL3 family transposase [Rectinemataceae bacterium]
MSTPESIERLGDWKGYRVGAVDRYEAGVKGLRRQAWIELQPDPGREKRCSGCNELVDGVHEYQERWIQDLPVWGADTWLLVYRCRLACPRCGPKLEQLDWVDRYARVTRRLADSVARLCQVLPIKHVAEHYGLGWETVKAIDKASLERSFGSVDLSDVEVIAMDEFALQKGQRYATVVVDPRTKRVLWVGRGRNREDVRPFFELLGPEGCARVRAVAMDMLPAFELEVRHHCPQAQIVYDLFHVVARYGHEVIDRVRVDEANRLRDNRPARKIVKSARWLLLRNRENLPTPEDRIRLKELLQANKALMTVYVLKDDLKQLWSYRTEGWARRLWKDWYRRAIRSRIKPLQHFAKKLVPYVPGILAHCRWPFHTSLLEGINNKIKVIKRMAFGFRDHAYFFLKIRAAFPGIAR